MLDAAASLNKGTGRLVVDWGQSTNVTDKLLQQCGLNQIRLLRDQGLLSQNHLFSSHWVCREQPPIDVPAVPEVWVIRVLQKEMKLWGGRFFFPHQVSISPFYLPRAGPQILVVRRVSSIVVAYTVIRLLLLITCTLKLKMFCHQGSCVFSDWTHVFEFDCINTQKGFWLTKQDSEGCLFSFFLTQHERKLQPVQGELQRELWGSDPHCSYSPLLSIHELLEIKLWKNIKRQKLCPERATLGGWGQTDGTLSSRQSGWVYTDDSNITCA